MFRPLTIALAVSTLLGTGLTARSTPITYDFSGTLDHSYQGSNQFSGTFTYDTDLPLNTSIEPSPGWSYYTGVPADPSEPVLSLKFNLGNTPSTTFGQLQSDELIVAHQASGSDGFFIQEEFLSRPGSGGGPTTVWAELGMANNNLIQRGPFSSTSPPSYLNLQDFSIGADLTVQINPTNGTGQMYVGTITSLTLETATPEPRSFLIFAFLGIGGKALRFRRRS